MQFDEGNRDNGPIRNVLMGLWRHVWLALFVMAAVMTLGTMYVFSRAPIYRATAYLEANFRTLPGDATSNRPGVTEAQAIMRTQSEIIVTRLVPRAVDLLDLTSDPEFNAALRQEEALSIAGFKAFVRKTLGFDRDRSPSAEEVRNNVIEAVRNQLFANGENQSHVITVSFWSGDPEKAARIVNTIAQQFITDQQELNRQQNKEAAIQISKRLKAAEERLARAESAAQQYREHADLIAIGPGGLTAAAQQLSQFNEQLVRAQVDRAQAQARLQQVSEALRTGAVPDSVDEVLKSALIQHLREKEAELRQKEAELSGTFGPEHPKMKNIEADLKNIETKIADEIRKIGKNITGSVAEARTKETELRSKISALEATMAKNSRAAVEAQDLQRQVDSAQRAYDDFATQLNVVDLRNDLGMPEARVIHLAETPVKAEPPGRSRQLSIVVVLSGMIAGVAALARERFDSRVWRRADVEGVAGQRVLAFVPTSRRRGSRPDRHVIDEPDGSLAEALHTVRTQITNVAIARRPMLLVATSAVPEEGKTTFCISLARVLSRWGYRVLLVDADLRKPQIGKLLGDDGRGTIDEVLNGSRSLQDVIQVDETGVHYIVAHPARDADKPLFSAAVMREIRFLLTDYDIVLFDTTPVMIPGTTDVVLKHSDYGLFLVRWGKIPVQVAKDALRRVQELNPNLEVGVIFSRVNLRKLPKYDGGYVGYYHRRYQSYYRRRAS